MGIAAKSQLANNYLRTLRYLPRLMGLNKQDQIIRERQFSAADLELDAETNMQYLQIENDRITPELALASVFHNICQNFNPEDFKNRPILVTIPSYATQEMKDALFKSARIADLRIALVKESEACIYEYAYNNLNKFQEDRTVAFIDIGLSKSSIFIVKYSKNEDGKWKAELLKESSDQNLGGRDLDQALLNYVADEFTKENDGVRNPKEIKKCRLRMEKEIDKARVTLSGDN